MLVKPAVLAYLRKGTKRYYYDLSYIWSLDKSVIQVRKNCMIKSKEQKSIHWKCNLKELWTFRFTS